MATDNITAARGLTTARSRPVIANIQALRAIAALMVGLMHAMTGQLSRHQDALLHALRHVMTFGHAGVDIFFVISGFIITTVGRQAAQAAKPGLNPRIAGVFAMHRVLRIFPLYWIVLVCSALTAGTVAEIIANPMQLFLLPPPRGLLEVAWTLTFEIYFYFVAAIALFLWARGFVWVLGIWAVLQFTLTITGVLHGALALSIVCEFIFGCAVAMLIESGLTRWPVAAVILAIAGFAAGAIVYLFFRSLFGELLNWRLLLFGVPATPLVYGLVVLERTRRLILPGWLQRRGTESYSFYLWHVPVINALLGIWVATSTLMTLIWISFMIALSLVVANLSYRFIERPTLRFAHRWR